jgi:uncharacterized protein (TIGR00304 family)
MLAQIMFNLGLGLVIIGFALVSVAVILMVFTAAKDKGKVKGGGVIVIGPFPIIFGTDKESIRIILVLSIVLTVLLLVFMLLSSQTFG